MRIFDLHNDTFTKLSEFGTTFCDNSLAVNLNVLNTFETTVCQYAVWISGSDTSDFKRYRAVLDKGRTELLKSNVKIMLSANNLRSVSSGNYALLSLEGAGFLQTADQVDELYQDGIRTVTLTWNHRNRLAGGAYEEGRLTPFGRSVIERMNRFNIAVDLAHLNRKSFFDALEVAKHPIVTHAGLDNLTPHKRNLTCEQVRAVAEHNGIIGLCLYPVFIGNDVEKGFLNAVNNLLLQGFEDNIAFGSDFDGAEMSQNVQSFKDVRFLYEKCINLFGDSVAEKLFFTNSYNFYVNVLTNEDK